jgi:hypothetical protein
MFRMNKLQEGAISNGNDVYLRCPGGDVGNESGLSTFLIQENKNITKVRGPSGPLTFNGHYKLALTRSEARLPSKRPFIWG